jgi:hypothetical protein
MLSEMQESSKEQTVGYNKIASDAVQSYLTK